jgi:hypothetical protein
VCWRDHTGVERYAGIAALRIDPLISAKLAVSALAAQHASAALSAHAGATALRRGDQPHPHLVKAYLAATRGSAPAPDSPWRSVIDRIDRRVTADASWPALARILNLAAGEGWDVSLTPNLAASFRVSDRPAALTPSAARSSLAAFHGRSGPCIGPRTPISHRVERVLENGDTGSRCPSRSPYTTCAKLSPGGRWTDATHGLSTTSLLCWHRM